MELYPSNVETVHRLIQDEFIDLETFSRRAELLALASLYQLYFNLARRSSHKRGLTPWQIIHQLAFHLPPSGLLASCLLLGLPPSPLTALPEDILSTKIPKPFLVGFCSGIDWVPARKWRIAAITPNGTKQGLTVC